MAKLHLRREVAIAFNDFTEQLARQRLLNPLAIFGIRDFNSGRFCKKRVFSAFRVIVIDRAVGLDDLREFFRRFRKFACVIAFRLQLPQCRKQRRRDLQPARHQGVHARPLVIDDAYFLL